MRQIVPDTCTLRRAVQGLNEPCPYERCSFWEPAGDPARQEVSAQTMMNREKQNADNSVPSRAAIDLYWLPLGAGGHSVRLNGLVYEALAARVGRRPVFDLYHSALEVHVPEGRFVIESAPIRANDGPERGVVGEGAVGSRDGDQEPREPNERLAARFRAPSHPTGTPGRIRRTKQPGRRPRRH
jgi:hypothetical protein